jgi:hypothetical protein
MVAFIMTIIDNAAGIIDALGGTAAVAQLTSTTPKAVHNWRAFDRFPANTFIVINSELMRLGISAPVVLWSMREPPIAKRKKVSA